MKTPIRFSPQLAFPSDYVTQVEVIIAKRRAGKSYAMRVSAEQLLLDHNQIVLIDPKGDQWGIRSSADGKSPGFPVLILGGEHGDLPLEKSAGELIARLVVEQQVSIVLDLSQFRKHEIHTFVTDFLENLYRLKAQEKFRTPVKIIVDESDVIAPQKPQHGEERMLGAIDDIVRRGGQRGIGCTLVTQRSAVLNKNVLTQAQTLMVLRTIAPQDLSAIRAWIEVHGSIAEGKALMDSLPSLPVGDMWVWSPGWPTDAGIFQRIHVSPITTFDSGATPKPGERRITPRNLADVDLEALKGQMAQTIEKAKASDPKLLQKEIADLKGKLKLHDQKAQQSQQIQQKPAPIIKEIIKKVEIPVLKDSHVTRLEAAIAALSKALSNAKIVMPNSTFQAIAEKPQLVPITTIKPTADQLIKVASTSPIDPGTLSGSERRIIDALGWYHEQGTNTPSRVAVALLAGYRSSGGGFANSLGSLRSRGLIDYPMSNQVTLTDLTVSTNSISIYSNADFHERVLDLLTPSEAKIMRAILAQAPASKSDIASSTGYHSVGGGFANLLGGLRTMGIIDYPSTGQVTATPVMYPLTH